MPARTDLPQPSRRGFLIAAAATGAGLTLGFHVPLSRAFAADAAVNPINAYVRIAPDGTVTVLAANMEGGQGAYTGIATLLAEELGADWSKIRVEGAWGNPQLYGNLAWGGKVQGTGGSSSMKSAWTRYRQAGAVARTMLVQAAADRWGVPTSEITVADGVLRDRRGHEAGFGELADAAAAVPPPADAPLKAPGEWRLIGDPALRRIDTADKTDGTHRYPLDVRLPGMLTAVLARPPLFGARLKGFDATAAKAVRGVVDVVATPRGVAVVGRDTWAAIKGREALRVDWDLGKAETRSTAELLALYHDKARSGPAPVAHAVGDAEAALKDAAKVIEAEFEFPYLAHAAMEPLDAVARFADGTLEIWAGHQMPDLYRAVGAQIMDLPQERVQLHVMTPGGFFGRRAVPDADVIVEVVSTLKAIGAVAPVKVVWTREDDMTGGRYRPMYVHRLRAGLDAAGRLTAWRQRIVGQSIMAGTPFAAMTVKNSVDATSVEGAANLAYAVPNLLVDLVTTEVGVPVLWWRSVGSTHTAYSSEVFMDEIAHAAGADPVMFRRGLLQDQPRHLAVLDLVAQKAGWGQPLPAGRFRGIALHESFGTVVAQVAEITLKDDGMPKVERVTAALDCGIAINPDTVRAQIEGGVGYGLGAILKSQITLDGGRVQQTNFDGYEVLRIDEMPSVEVHILPSEAAPTGVGEPGVPPIGPAVANAYFAATGKRIRALPFSQNLTSA